MCIYIACRLGPSASVVLPSFLKRRRSNAERTANIKRAKPVQCWDRDIICLPDEHGVSRVPYPRGKYRAKLAALGLIGKIRLLSSMTVQEVENEIRSVFKKPMGSIADFPFQYLQSTGGGSRTLTVPCVSSSFSWTAQQVAKLGSSVQPIYIMAKDELVDDCDPEVFIL